MSQRILRRNHNLEDVPGPSEPTDASHDEPGDPNEVPSFNDILGYAKEFSTAHQSLATLMVNMGVLTKKKFYISFIRDVIRIHLKRNPDTVSRIACSVEELDNLVSLLFSELNPRLSGLGLRLTSIADEETGREMVILVSEDVLPKDISSISGFSADELTLFARYIPQFVEGCGQCESSWALNEATNLSNPMTLMKAQNFLDKLANVGWISEKGDTIWLEPRAIAELEPVLTTKYGCSTCILCQKVVVRRDISVICGSCDAHIHRHCWLKARWLQSLPSVLQKAPNTNVFKKKLKEVDLLALLGIEDFYGIVQAPKLMTYRVLEEDPKGVIKCSPRVMLRGGFIDSRLISRH